MSVAGVDVERLLRDSTRDLFTRHSGPELWRAIDPGGWSPDLWAVTERSELTLLGVPDEAGGAGGGASHWAIAVGMAARHAAPIPLAEAGVAGRLAHRVGLDVPRGPLTVARARPDGPDAMVADGVPYGRHAAVVVTLPLDGALHVGVLPAGAAAVTPSTNLAGEPRDELRFAVGALAQIRSAPDDTPAALDERMALARSIQIAGALEAVQEMTVRHARERVQFGSPLARLPVVRERLALLAEESAAAGAAAAAAVDALSNGAGRGAVAIAAAKVRAGAAAGQGARLAHQLHGAIGVTEEHALHHLTRRLWAWRDEEGDERHWARWLGRAVATRGGDGLWPLIVEQGPSTRSEDGG